MTEAPSPKTEPVTMVFARDVKPDRIEEFEEWINGISLAVRQFDGYQGMDVIRPSDHGHQEYVMILRFDEYHHMRMWMSSPEREKWVGRAGELTMGETYIQEAHGFEPWFTLPDHQHAAKAPAKYKMALLTMAAIYPLLLVVSTALNMIFPSWPRELVILLTVVLLVSLMTFYVMPWVTKGFRFWLYPEAKGE
jgi:hypothetical protein